MLNKDHIPDEQNNLKNLEDRGWATMAQLLNAEMPIQKKRRGLAAWWWLGAAALIGYGLFKIPFTKTDQHKDSSPIVSRVEPQEIVADAKGASPEARALSKQNAANEAIVDKNPVVNSTRSALPSTKSINTLSSVNKMPAVPDPVFSPTDSTLTTSSTEENKNLRSTVLPPVPSESTLRANPAPTRYDIIPFIEPHIIPLTYYPSLPVLPYVDPVIIEQTQSKHQTAWTLALQGIAGTGFSQNIESDKIIKSGLHTLGFGLQLGYSFNPKLEVSTGLGLQRWDYQQVLFRPKSNPQLLFGADSYQEFYNANRAASPSLNSPGSQLNYLTIPVSVSYNAMANLWIEAGFQPAVDLDIPSGTVEAVRINQAGDPILDKSSGGFTNTANVTAAQVSLPLYRRLHGGYHVGLGWRVNALEFGIRWYTSTPYLSADLLHSRDYKHESLTLAAKYRFTLAKKQ